MARARSVKSDCLMLASLELIEMEYGYVYPYYYPSSESTRTAIAQGGQLSHVSASPGQPVTNATVSNNMGQSLRLGNRSQVTLGNQSPAVGVSVNISGSSDTVSTFITGGHHLEMYVLHTPLLVI